MSTKIFVRVQTFWSNGDTLLICMERFDVAFQYNQNLMVVVDLDEYNIFSTHRLTFEVCDFG